MTFEERAIIFQGLVKFKPLFSKYEKKYKKRFGLKYTPNKEKPYDGYFEIWTETKKGKKYRKIKVKKLYEKPFDFKTAFEDEKYFKIFQYYILYNFVLARFPNFLKEVEKPLILKEE